LLLEVCGLHGWGTGWRGAPSARRHDVSSKATISDCEDVERVRVVAAILYLIRFQELIAADA
jgi:hypothetical protein